MSIPSLQLSRVTFSKRERCVEDMGNIEIEGKSLTQLMQEVWDRFNVTKEGDRELIVKGLSSPLKYDSLAFFLKVKGKNEVSYRIQKVNCQKAKLFPKMAMRKEILKKRKRIYFRDVVFSRGIALPTEQKFSFNEVKKMNRKYPEIGALYNSESFSSLVETNSKSALTYRVFRVD